jgi:hypothetical protein
VGRRVSPFRFTLLCCGGGLAFFALAGCHKSGAARLEGHWRGSKAEGVAGDAQTAANGFAMQMELDVKGDTISVRTIRDKQSSKFKVVREDKTSVVIQTEADAPKDEQLFTFGEGDRSIKWTVSEGKTITFNKESP